MRDHPLIIVFDPDGATVTKESPLTGRENTLRIPRLTEGQFDSWLAGDGLIQDIMRNISSEHREFLMTGYTPEDWATLFPARQEEE